ncbi:MAG: hypothetical protein P4M08_03745 [Oligoflexia bacterium]|nr:hypothetical protein [Oligoflexia bacterium]
MQVPLIGNRLDELLLSGVRHVTSFLPWQALESDISHTLVRFLQGISERNMTVSLIVSPEVGIHYPNSGLPKDILGKTEAAAQSIERGPIVIGLPPNQFAIPSLLSSDFTKRYYSFIARVDSLLADFEKTQGRPLNFITLVLTGSLWKYYRPSTRSSSSPYFGACGDYSANAAVSFRQRLDDFYSHAEFTESSPSAANRWKTHEMERINRAWFYQQCEAIFRNRTLHFARRRAKSVNIREIELFTPEADPSLTYSYFLQSLSSSRRGADFERLSGLVDEAASVGSMGSQSAAVPFVHWSTLGGFRALSDSERQFLVLKSLLLAGGCGGGVLIDEDEWLSFSRGFRNRVEKFARAVDRGDLRLRNEVLYLCPHLWSGPGLWSSVFRKAGLSARKISSLDWVEQGANQEALVLIVDPSLVLTRETVQRLLRWQSQAADRVLVLPRSALYSDGARALLDSVGTSRKIEISLGVSYRLQPLGTGKLVVYDPTELDPTRDLSGPEWDKFFGAVTALAEVEDPIRASDARLSLIPLARRDQSVGLFILNGTRGSVSGDILFPTSVSISDLMNELSSNAASRDVKAGAGAPAARRFALDVPACGVLPLSVDRVGLGTRSDNRAADQLGALGKANSLAAAAAELPGLGTTGEGGEASIWS